jgi:hypothetical protein
VYIYVSNLSKVEKKSEEGEKMLTLVKNPSQIGHRFQILKRRLPAIQRQHLRPELLPHIRPSGEDEKRDTQQARGGVSPGQQNVQQLIGDLGLVQGAFR